MSWRREHPDAGVPEDVQALLERLGFADSSWHNDVCPHWAMQLGHEDLECTLDVWVDYADMDRREFENERYSVSVGIGHSEQTFVVLATEDKGRLVAWLNDDLVEPFDKVQVMPLANIKSVPPPLLVAMASISRKDVTTAGELYSVSEWLDGNPCAASELISLCWSMAGDGAKGW